MEWGPRSRPMWIKFAPFNYYLNLLSRKNSQQKNKSAFSAYIYLLSIRLGGGIQNIDLRGPSSVSLTTL